ncbi:zinc finger protein 761-like [Lates japonicus]
MTNYVTRGFRAQLTTAMDSVLRKAVIEIMQIFENSLHEHQMELAQKGEEVAHLKIKLQAAEIKLREHERGGDRAVEVNITPVNETQRESEVVLNPSGQSSDVPEIDFEVPDDWCAPLGCEPVTKQEDGVCPSVRLRRLSIPLWPLPIIKQEVAVCDIDSHQQTKGVRRWRRGSALNERHKHTQKKILPSRRNPVRNDMQKLLQDIKQEYSDQTVSLGIRRRRRVNLTGKEQENTVRSRRQERKVAVAKSAEQKTAGNGSEKKYTCKFCKKVFDTMFGRSVHVRSHKRCQGCKKEFPFPSSLRCHKSSCVKFKRLLAKEAPCSNPPKAEPCGDENQTLPSKKQVIIKKENSPSPGSHSKCPVQKDGSTKKYPCPYCSKTFRMRCSMKDHVRVHTGEKPFLCSMCPKKFRLNQLLKNHTLRMHNNQIDSSETNGDLAWTKPLEDTEDNQQHLNSPSKDTSHTVKRNKVQRRCSPDRKRSERWQTMGIRCSNGFSCLWCHKVTSNKHLLIEHYRIHTGERPIKCKKCPAKFRTCQQLYLHKKKKPLFYDSDPV